MKNVYFRHGLKAYIERLRDLETIYGRFQLFERHLNTNLMKYIFHIGRQYSFQMKKMCFDNFKVLMASPKSFTGLKDDCKYIPLKITQ